MNETPAGVDPPAAARRGRGISLALLLAFVAAVAAYPPLYAYNANGPEACFDFFAADAFYYLRVASQSASSNLFFTFDGIHATNGFHPLWQWILTGAFVLDGGHPEQVFQIKFAFFTGIFGVTASMMLIAAVLHRMKVGAAAILIAMVPGIFYVLTRTYSETMHAHALWSFMNGMESPLSLLLFSALLACLAFGEFLTAPPGNGRIFGISALISLLVLSRLDDIFMFVPFFGYLLLSGRGQPRGMRLARPLVAALPPLALIGGALAVNLATAGSALPSSGMAKSGFAAPYNCVAFLQMFLPFDWGLENHAEFAPIAQRGAHMFLPLFASLAVFFVYAHSRKGGESRIAPASPAMRIMLFLAVYVLGKALYNIINVHYWHQGHWYFPLSILFVNMCAGLVLGRLNLEDLGRRWGIGTKTVTCAVALCVLFWTVSFASYSRHDSHHGRLYRLWESGAQIKKEIRTTYEGKGFIEFDDGIVSYSLDMPALAGFGFALDKEGGEAKRAGKLLKLAYDRGFNAFASLVYPPRLTPEAHKNPAKLREELKNYPWLAGEFGAGREDLDAWDFEIIYFRPESRLTFIRFTPAR